MDSLEMSEGRRPNQMLVGTAKDSTAQAMATRQEAIHVRTPDLAHPCQ